MMTFEVAFQILESLKDHVNDKGRGELSAVQDAITEWRSLGTRSVFVEEPVSIPESEPEPKPKEPKKKKISSAPKAKKRK